MSKFRNRILLIGLAILAGIQIPLATAAHSQSSNAGQAGNTIRGALIGSVRANAEGAAIATQMEERADRLEAALPPEIVVLRVGEGIVLSGPGENDLKIWDLATMPLWEELRTDRSVQVYIIGHSAIKSTAEEDMAVSYRLAQAMQKFITSISDRNVRIDGRGRTEPITSNETPTGRIINSRIEVGLYVPWTD